MYRAEFRIPKAFLWIIGITGVSTLVMMVAVGSQSGFEAEMVGALIGITFIQVFMGWLLMRPCRITVSPSGIDISYRPFNIGPKHVAWSEVAKVYHAKVDPMGDFMGYGVRMKGWKREQRVIAYAFEEGRYAFFVRHNAPTFAFQITDSERWNEVLNGLEGRGIEIER
jgi:hypothetical protein